MAAKESIDKIPAENSLPLDPKSLRVSNAITGMEVEKRPGRVNTRKPKRTEFIRASTDPEYRSTAFLYEHEIEMNREQYLVGHNMIGILNELDPGRVRPILLVTCTNIHGDFFLWPVPLESDNLRNNSWHESARECLKEAENGWVRLIPNTREGNYDIFVAHSQEREPKWPAESFTELYNRAFSGGKYIDSPDHPIIKALEIA